MRKLFISVIVALACAGALYAQDGKPWEIEPSLGLNYPVSGVEGMYDTPFFRFGLEYRHVLKDTPVWLGAQLSLQSCARMYNGDRDEYQSFGKGFRTLSLMAVGEYRFKAGRTVCVFGGVGLGVSQRAAMGWEGAMFGFAAAPRVGLQVNGHARIFFDVLLTSRYFNAVSLNFGWAF